MDVWYHEHKQHLHRVFQWHLVHEQLELRRLDRAELRCRDYLCYGVCIYRLVLSCLWGGNVEGERGDWRLCFVSGGGMVRCFSE